MVGPASCVAAKAKQQALRGGQSVDEVEVGEVGEMKFTSTFEESSWKNARVRRQNTSCVSEVRNRSEDRARRRVRSWRRFVTSPSFRVPRPPTSFAAQQDIKTDQLLT